MREARPLGDIQPCLNLRRLIREFARVTFRTYLPALLAASPAPIARKLHSFIVRPREAIAIVSTKVLSSAHSRDFRARKKKRIALLDNEFRTSFSL